MLEGLVWRVGLELREAEAAARELPRMVSWSMAMAEGYYRF
jgi:hypothetical protein